MLPSGSSHRWSFVSVVEQRPPVPSRHDLPGTSWQLEYVVGQSGMSAKTGREKNPARRMSVQAITAKRVIVVLLKVVVDDARAFAYFRAQYE
jgi:hypothetical protein